MKHVSILVPYGHTSLSNIEGTHQILSEVNVFLAAMERPPAFKVELVGLEHDTRQRNGLFTVNPDKLIGDVQQTDLIIIPALHGDPQRAMEANKAFLPWIVAHYNEGAEVASFCIGAFFLAATGLLKGKQCATHWRLANDFRMMYPEINVVDEKIMTDEDRIYTSGGAYAYLNLLLYLIEKYVGRELAVLTSKAFMIDINRDSQSPFMIFQGQKGHEDPEIRVAQDYIERNFQERITVDQLAAMLSIGRRSLERRFKKATCNTVTEYIQRVKIEAAKMTLESSRENVNEVMYKVGYNDTKAFRITFKRITGLSPLQYRNRYNKEAVMGLE